MEHRYNRNRLYIGEADQQKMKNFSILVAGCGIGSVIAECALRAGFEKICIIDGDHIELSNLNRQNFIEDDINQPKVLRLYRRLKSINKNAEITFQNTFINKDNVVEMVNHHDVAINALDFKDETPLLFDEICFKNKIPVLHPYNLGWAGLVTVLDGNTPLTSIENTRKLNEVRIVQYIIENERKIGKPIVWLEKIIEDYQNEKAVLSPPQLSIGTYYVAAMCTHLLYQIATGQVFKTFPEYYLQSIL